MKKILFVFIAFMLIIQLGAVSYADNVELVLHKDFIQNLMNSVFPLTFKETYTPNIQLSHGSDVLSFDYSIIINDPVISIKPDYIQLDATVDWVSLLGKQSSKGKFKFVPVFNKDSKHIEFRVIEGKFDLKVNLGGNVIDLGEIDISKEISDIKIPLEYNNIKISEKNISVSCENVTFKLLDDRIIVNSEVKINKG